MGELHLESLVELPELLNFPIPSSLVSFSVLLSGRVVFVVFVVVVVVAEPPLSFTPI